MKKVKLYRISLIICIIFTILGADFKIQHYPYSQLLLGFATISSLGFIIPALIDVFSNEKNKLIAKFAWLICFIFLSWITGLLYFKTYARRNN
jgi:hypothetical protein